MIYAKILEKLLAVVDWIFAWYHDLTIRNDERRVLREEARRLEEYYRAKATEIDNMHLSDDDVFNLLCGTTDNLAGSDVATTVVVRRADTDVPTRLTAVR